MIGAGLLDQRITIQRRATGEDANGQPSAAWTDVCTVWAQAMTKRGREYISAGQEQSAAMVVFRIRYRTDVVQDAALRVLWRGVPYGLVEPAQDVGGQRSFIEMACATGRKDA